MTRTADDYPREYKAQRKLEKEAAASREELLSRGATLPPICGFTYKPRKPTSIAAKDWRPKMAICQCTAGQGTNHHGVGFCDYHDVQARKEGNRQRGDVKTAKDLAYQNAKFFGVAKPTDPHTALMDEISRTAGIIGWLEDKLTLMSESGQTHEDILTQYNVKFGIQPSAWYQILIEERKHLTQTCVAAIKAGVAERRVQIAEQQGRIIVAMMMAFIHDKELGLTPEQIMKAPQLVRKHLTSLPMQSNSSDAQQIIEAHAS